MNKKRITRVILGLIIGAITGLMSNRINASEYIRFGNMSDIMVLKYCLSKKTSYVFASIHDVDKFVSFKYDKDAMEAVLNLQGRLIDMEETNVVSEVRDFPSKELENKYKGGLQDKLVSIFDEMFSSKNIRQLIDRHGEDISCGRTTHYGIYPNRLEIRYLCEKNYVWGTETSDLYRVVHLKCEL